MPRSVRKLRRFTSRLGQTPTDASGNVRRTLALVPGSEEYAVGSLDNDPSHVYPLRSEVDQKTIFIPATSIPRLPAKRLVGQ